MIHCKVVPHQLCLMDYRPKTSSISLPQSLDILVVNQRYLQDEAFQMIAKLTHITWFMRDITIPYDTTVALKTNITGGGGGGRHPLGHPEIGATTLSPATKHPTRSKSHWCGPHGCETFGFFLESYSMLQYPAAKRNMLGILWKLGESCGLSIPSGKLT